MADEDPPDFEWWPDGALASYVTEVTAIGVDTCRRVSSRRATETSPAWSRSETDRKRPRPEREKARPRAWPRSQNFREAAISILSIMEKG